MNRLGRTTDVPRRAGAVLSAVAHARAICREKASSLSVRLTVAMVALVLLTATTIGVVTHRNVEALALPRALDRFDKHARLVAAELEASVRGTRGDVTTQGQTVDKLAAAILAGGRHPVDGTPEAQWRERLATRFVAELKAKPTYVQYRLIGLADGAREVVRVDRSGPSGAIRIVPQAELQRKGDRDYFAAAIGLAPGEVHASSIDFNREWGAISTPNVPTLRVAAAAFAPDGKPFGILIINVNLQDAFDRIRSARLPGGSVSLVNEQGHYLVHPDRRREFAFEFGKQFRLQDDFPEIAEALEKGKSEPRMVRSREGDQFAVALASVRLAQARRVTVVVTTPQSEVLAAAAAVRNSSLLAGFASALGAVVLAVVLARSLTRPVVQMTRAVEGFARGELVAVPIEASGEMGVLARAFARMTVEAEEKTAALRESTEREQGIIGTALDAFVQMDEAGRIVEWNPQAEAIFGWQRTEVLGQTLGSLIVPPIHRNQHEAGLARFLRSGESSILGTRFEIEALRRDGRQIRVEVTVTALRRRRGYLFNGFIRDMTERLRLEQQLRHSQKMEAIGQLIGGLAHDFNNLLTIVTGNHELLDARIKDEAHRALLTRANEAALMGSRLTGRLLAFARRHPLDIVPIDLNEQVRGMVDLLRRTLGETIVLTAALAPDLWVTSTDPSGIENALLNLAINARDAMPAGGKLIIETKNVTLEESSFAAQVVVAAGDYVRLSVSDTGIGMPPEVLARAFEPFFTTKEAGSGLGLSVVYGFARQSGGHVTMYSEVGTGTTVNLYLPRANNKGARFTPQGTAQSYTAAGETILVVEDQPAVREVTVQRLRDLGYTAIEADSASGAIDILQSGVKIDLVFSDVVMPGGKTGFDLAGWIRSNTSGVRILLTSGFADAVARTNGKPGDATQILRKPYSRDELVRAIGGVLNKAVDTA